MELLALGQADLELGPAVLPVHGGWDQCVPGSLGQSDELTELVAMKQEFAVAYGVWGDMGRRCR